MLADELGMSRLYLDQVVAFKQAIEQDHNVKIRFVSGGEVVRGDITYVRRGCIAFYSRDGYPAVAGRSSWAEVDRDVHSANEKALHQALERLGDILHQEDMRAW